MWEIDHHAKGKYPSKPIINPSSIPTRIKLTHHEHPKLRGSSCHGHGTSQASMNLPRPPPANNQFMVAVHWKLQFGSKQPPLATNFPKSLNDWNLCNNLVAQNKFLTNLYLFWHVLPFPKPFFSIDINQSSGLTGMIHSALPAKPNKQTMVFFIHQAKKRVFLDFSRFSELNPESQ